MAVFIGGQSRTRTQPYETPQGSHDEFGDRQNNTGRAL
jgi:hypothetical protein